MEKQLASLKTYLEMYETEFTVNGHWAQDHIVEVTPNYDNAEQSSADKQNLENGTNAPYAYALAEAMGLGYDGRTRQALDSWCLTNTGHSGSEGALTLVYKGQRILEAAAMCGYDAAVWATNVYLPACDAIISAGNWGSKGNWGAWGMLGRMMVYAHVGLQTALDSEASRLVAHIQNATKKCLFVEEGDLWPEAYRNNYCLSYMSFFLTPALRAAMLSPVVAQALYKPLEKYWAYCKGRSWPTRFPYKKLFWPLGWLQQRIWAAGDDFHTPEPDNWAGSLFRTAGYVYGVDEWKAWSPDCDTTATTLFRYPDAFWSAYKLGRPI